MADHTTVNIEGQTLPLTEQDAKRVQQETFERSKLIAVIMQDPVTGRGIVQVLDPDPKAVEILEYALVQLKQTLKGH